VERWRVRRDICVFSTAVGRAFLVGAAAGSLAVAALRLSFVQEPSGTTDRLVFQDLLLEARRSIHSLSSAAGLLRIVRWPQWSQANGEFE
jgi:hypothetical protein